MRRLLASGLPRRAGQPVKALVHIYFTELREMDQDSALQDKWIEEYRAWWAAHRAAASVSTGDGGAGLEGDVARQVVCDAMTVPVVILRDRRHRPLRGRGPDRRVRPVPSGSRRGRRRPRRRRRGTIVSARPADGAAAAEQVAGTEQSAEADRVGAAAGHAGAPDPGQRHPGRVRPRRVASLLRRNLLGKGLNGPPCRWTSARPTTSGSTCGAWWPCGIRRASSPADTSFKHTLTNGPRVV